MDKLEKLQIEKALCRSEISAFIAKSFPIVDPNAEYLHNWHIDCIAEYLHAVHKGDTRRLIVNMPPRSAKSISISIAFPAWLLGKDPTERIIVSSFAESLSLRHSTDTRTIMESDFYKYVFPDTEIAKDQNQKIFFQTTARGFRKATTVGSGITGDGGNYLIIDDPVSPKEALSEKARITANQWFDQTLVSRQNDKKTSKMILVMQRLHAEDLTAHLLNKGGWEHLVLPVIAPSKHVIKKGGITWTRQAGELLHEDREDDKVIEDLRKDMGPYAFAGQYMQNPAPVGGGEFKSEWIQYYDYHNKFDVRPMNIWILVDPANEKKANSDWTAMVVVGLSPDNNYYILDIVRDRLNPTERINKLISLHKKWNQLGGKPPQVGYEKYGMQTDTFYLKKAQDTLNYRFMVQEVAGRLKKEDRIRRLIPLFEGGRVYFPRNLMYHNYNGETIDLVKELVTNEMLTFPVGSHDDMLDAFARICDDELLAYFPKLKGPVEINIHDDFHDEPRDDGDFMSW